MGAAGACFFLEKSEEIRKKGPAAAVSFKIIDIIPRR